LPVSSVILHLLGRATTVDAAYEKRSLPISEHQQTDLALPPRSTGGVHSWWNG
jgi:hypothetical protein